MQDAEHASRRSVSFLVVAALALTVTSACKKEGPSPAPGGASPVPAVTVSPSPIPTPTLHAWANPIEIAGVRFADHTWVTTYDAASQCPPPQAYWYSWGGCHGIGPGTSARPLATHAADLGVARCICAPDLEDYSPTPDNPAHGGIDLYGISGVCHQLSNRILWAATKGAGEPVTVDKALGYGVSRYVFGTYGINASEWQARILRCAPPTPPTPAAGTPVAMAMAVVPVRNLVADLEAMIQERLGGELPRAKAARVQQIRASLLASKAALDRAVRSGEIPPARFASGVNDLINQRLREAAEVLTPAEYERLYGIPPGMRIGIVDPTIAEKSSYRLR